MPDAELRSLAETGALLQPEVQLAQTRRLLASPKSDAFVEGFLNTWLYGSVLLQHHGNGLPIVDNGRGDFINDIYQHPFDDEWQRRRSPFCRRTTAPPRVPEPTPPCSRALCNGHPVSGAATDDRRWDR